MAQKFMDEHSATISRDQDLPDDDRVLGKQNSYLLPTCATAPLPDHVRRENLELWFPADGYNYLVHLRDTKAYDASAVSVQNVKQDLIFMKKELTKSLSTDISVETDIFIIEYENVIHKFDTYFNHRATQVSGLMWRDSFEEVSSSSLRGNSMYAGRLTIKQYKR